MKRSILIALIFAAITVATAWVSYSLGQRRGYNLGVVLDEKGAFVGSFDALEKIRTGDVDGGIRRLESTCFAAAAIVYAGHPECASIAKMFSTDFRRYRHTYRTNSAEWTPMERILEKELAGK